VRLTILGSGSEGNALLVESGATSVLVDAGLSHRALCRRFSAIGRAVPEEISAVLVTHGHSDHAAHASTYAMRFECGVRASEATLRTLPLRAPVPREAFPVGRAFRIGDLTVRAKAIPHDAPQVALVFESAERRVGLVTDLGHVPRGLSRFLDGCETLLLESNHDADMLATGPYPASLKRRVGSTHGHLSNAQAGDLLAALDYAPEEVVLMHLSRSNNMPHLARASAEAALGHRGTRVRIADQTAPVELGAVRPSQLRLEL
jgi:phosphoribosyl 1,2-cyclic phosphodiesterase